jgi:ketopantoate reductase
MPRAGSISKNNDGADGTALCVDAAWGGLSALAVVPNGELARDPLLRRLLRAVADEAAGAARLAGRRVAGRPGALAERLCRGNPRGRHPWQRALRAGRPTGAAEVYGPLLRAARRGDVPVPKLAVIAAVLERLERPR